MSVRCRRIRPHCDRGCPHCSSRITDCNTSIPTKNIRFAWLWISTNCNGLVSQCLRIATNCGGVVYCKSSCVITRTGTRANSNITRAVYISTGIVTDLYVTITTSIVLTGFVTNRYSGNVISTCVFRTSKVTDCYTIACFVCCRCIIFICISCLCICTKAHCNMTNTGGFCFFANSNTGTIRCISVCTLRKRNRTRCNRIFTNSKRA